jgi:hypothetical protein
MTSGRLLVEAETTPTTAAGLGLVSLAARDAGGGLVRGWASRAAVGFFRFCAGFVVVTGRSTVAASVRDCGGTGADEGAAAGAGVGAGEGAGEGAELDDRYGSGAGEAAVLGCEAAVLGLYGSGSGPPYAGGAPSAVTASIVPSRTTGRRPEHARA